MYGENMGVVIFIAVAFVLGMVAFLTWLEFICCGNVKAFIVAGFCSAACFFIVTILFDAFKQNHTRKK